jgi:hypothetical protein
MVRRGITDFDQEWILRATLMTFIHIAEYTVNTDYIQYACEHQGRIVVLFGEGSSTKSASITKEQWDAIVQTVLLASNPGLAGSSWVLRAALLHPSEEMMAVKFVDKFTIGFQVIVEAKEGFLLGGCTISDNVACDTFFEALAYMNAVIEDNRQAYRRVKVAKVVEFKGMVSYGVHVPDKRLTPRWNP